MFWPVVSGRRRGLAKICAWPFGLALTAVVLAAGCGSGSGSARKLAAERIGSCLQRQHLAVTAMTPSTKTPLGGTRAHEAKLLVVGHTVGSVWVYPSDQDADIAFSKTSNEFQVLQHDNVVVLLVAPIDTAARPVRTVERCAFGPGAKPRASSLVVNAGTSPGRAVLLESGCLACHRIGALGNNGPGPILNNVGVHLSAREIADRLIHPAAPMPSFKGLGTRKLQALVSYLSHLHGS